MAGYDGHRGSAYYLGVHPDYQGQDYGHQIMEAVEQMLMAMGCPKLNILIRSSNSKVIKFYEALGYHVDEVSSMGKRLITD
jgi:ribosomal protein S18 acetylase RimI-like enzyme